MLYPYDNFNCLLNKHKSGNELIFIHTPKCAGKYTSQILELLKIKNKKHKQAIKNEGITFTVIRNPVERFESLLNYRLDEAFPRKDWPRHLHYVFDNKNISLNEIVSKMTDTEILGFEPYRTLIYWIENVDIIITIDELPKLLKMFGYTYDINSFKKVNVSNKIRGKLDETTKNRISKLYYADMNLYNKVTHSLV